MRVSPGTRCYKSFHSSKSQSLCIGTFTKPPLNHSLVSCTISSFGSCQNFHLINFMKVSIRAYRAFPAFGELEKSKFSFPGCGWGIGDSLSCGSLGKSRSFSSFRSVKTKGVRSGNKLPWLAGKWSEKSTRKRDDQSSWKKPNVGSEKMRSSSREHSGKTFERRDSRLIGDESAKRYGKPSIKSASRSSWEVSAENFVRQGSESVDERIQGRSIRVDEEDWQKDYIERGNRSSSGKRYGKPPIKSASRSSWEVSAENFVRQGSESVNERIQGRSVRVNEEDWRKDYTERGENYEDVEDEVEAVADPRWDKIKSRFRGLDEKVAPERPEIQRWNKQESWGRKTLREASESTIPKMVGEGLYGLGPVLAALSAGRREFYALYMQEGIDLSNNNRKKKDKKGFEKVLKLAEKNALTIKEISKHDLNMITDNRPHQGLVLDASPLEMVKIKELDPVSLEEDRGSLWLALDEVTDPQNLGAIIRSSYFFGASGVVLCAKNSARLSGVVSKASAGSLELMELRYCKNMMQFLTSSAENGWRVLGASVSSKAVALKEILPDAPTILVMGSEGTGLRPLVERSCTQLVKIPGNMPVDLTMEKDDDIETTQPRNGCSLDEFKSFLAVESLNVSVAAGVLVHHLIGNNYKNDDSHLSGSDDSLEISTPP